MDEFQIINADRNQTQNQSNLQLAQIRILDDVKQKGKSSFQYTNVFICPSDFNACVQLFENGGIPQKTNLMAVIKTHRERFYSKQIPRK